MSAVLGAREPSARYLEADQPALVRQFELLATAPGAVMQLRELILALAVQGKLVRQDARDEPASELLERIAGERTRLIAAGKLRKSKDSTEDDASEPPYSLPQGWAWSKLTVIGIINPRNDAADDVVASFVQMSSIAVAFNDPHTTEARPWHDIKSGFTQFAEGDVGVAKITPCFENGKSTVFQNLSNGIGAGTTELHVVRPLCGVAPRYVLLFLKSPRFLREGEATMTGTAGQKRLPRSFFENCPFPLPPLAEQARIVTRVDELMRLCDALEAQGRLEAEQHARLLGTLLGTLTDSSTPDELAANWQRIADHFDLLLDRPEAVDALEQTILQLAVRGLLVPQDPSDEPASDLLARISAERSSLVAAGKLRRDWVCEPVSGEEEAFALPAGWSWARTGDLVFTSEAGWSPTCHPTPRRTGKWGVLKVSAVSWGDFDPEANKELPDGLSARLDYEVKAGDFLLSRANTEELVARSVVVGEAPGKLMLSDKIIRLNTSEHCDRAFLCMSNNSAHTRTYFVTHASGTSSSMKNVSREVVLAAPVALPPIAEQSRIVARVTELRRLCADLRQRLTASRTTQSHLADALVDLAVVS